MDRKKTQFKAPACLGLPGRVRIYNLHEKKLEQPVVSSLVIQKNKKKYRFYCPDHSTRIVESGNARLIKNGEISGSVEPRHVMFLKLLFPQLLNV